MLRDTTKRRIAVALGGALAAAALASPASAVAATRVIDIRDACDETSFNAAGLDCHRIDSSGKSVTLDELVAELGRKSRHEAWRFAPPDTTIREGETLTARVSRGGEAHTFTELPAFGPGCVEPINALVFGDPTLNPICADPAAFPGTLLVPGQSLTVPGLPRGEHRFQCLIHPWMRTEVTVR